MEPKRTDKELLGKGVQRMAIAIIFMFISPVIIHSAFKNQDHPLYIPILLLGLAGALFAIIMAFKGIKTIMDSFFGKK
ncbi:DUF6095 family protein [Aquimarina sediminis]|uniref:DUF6095 family protein n=1 Tax=Aquimarina sediminis TaxID=2070536 RepID=UPI000CA063A5|nr:DUF6095 family protein [Aquimarina sediminis]